MPPSPVMRVSPGRGLKVENHRRGRSLKSGIVYRHKEDDLTLFNDVRNRERDGFLLQSNDNFDDFFTTKLRDISVHKLEGSAPARGESSDLLNAERDKNDYDWLITPPETPLFRSLNDEAQPVKPVPRGRPRSQPVSVSRSPTMEKDYRSGRGKASPHRLGPSPRSGNSTLQSRSRPFSASCSSPPPTMQHPSPARRLSPSPTKQTSGPRSSSPTPRRISTGSTGASSPSRVRGSSPIKMSQGNSVSPKIKAWQANIPGFSSEVPPNLCTSLADRPASHVRSSSPASRNSSRYGRQSMSPIASRSVASSHSHDQDQFSRYSKDSVASSGDNDVELLESIALSSSERSAPRNLGAHPSKNATNFSRKPSQNVSSSAPKRSFDLVRQLDRKGPHNMFRPLLSSVPSSTFHAGKVIAHQRSLMSRNSSMTTSSSASYDQAASGAHDPEGRKLNQDDVTSDCMRGNHPVMDDELFVMEHADDINEDIENRIMDDSPRSQHRENDSLPIGVSTLNVGSSNEFDCLDANSAPDTVTCSKCGYMFHSAEVVKEGDRQLCLECKCLEVRSTIMDPSNMVMVGQNNTWEDVQIIEHGSQEVLDQLMCNGPTGKYNLDTQISYSGSSLSLSVELFEEGEPTLASEKVIEQLISGHKGYEVNSSSRLNVSDGAGISLLLKRSISAERHVVQSRSFTASTISCDDFSYVPESLNSMRSSTGVTSVSVSSSIDLGSSRQTEFRNSWQSSGHKSDTENFRHEFPSKFKRSVSSASSASGHMFQVRSSTPGCHQDSFEETRLDPREQSVASEFTEAESTCSNIESNIVLEAATELSSRLMDDHSGETSVNSALTSREPGPHENRDNSMGNSHNLSIVETSSAQLQTSNQVDDVSPISCANAVDAAEFLNHNSFNAISENEIGNGDSAYYGSHSNVDSPKSKGCTGVQDASAVKVSSKEFEISHLAHIALEESHSILEDTGQVKAKTLTLEEAADAILFCSSIIHNLAYEAANIAIDKEALSGEAPRPAVMLVGKSNFERRDARPIKRGFRSQKARKQRLQAKMAPSSCNAESDEKSSPCTIGVSDDGAPYNGDSMKPPPKLESKCNCLIM
ncbi:hypothetical protein SASPL_140206 [Salvia splendens]|uniref:Uncharacterized protein n=1 Tax=Salvia splendens TaxID=180675 RepID=A0A8X8WPL4_SALSN|nr:uncharacterized protein LOC121768533 [Salvia splendens]KAG6398737.1 hypothetical protein SASPL_140206 [Salvia splendens]